MPAKNFIAISSLQVARVVRFATYSKDIYGIPGVKEWRIIRRARFRSSSSCSV